MLQIVITFVFDFLFVCLFTQDPKNDTNQYHPSCFNADTVEYKFLKLLWEVTFTI